MPIKKKGKTKQKAKAYLAKKARKRKMPPKDPDSRAKKLARKHDPAKKK